MPVSDQKGMTYIEVLVYVFILSIILLAFGYFAVNLLYDRTRGTAQTETREVSRLAMERIIREIERAKSVRTASSTFGQNVALTANGGKLLSLQMASSTLDPTEFSVLNNMLYIKQGSATASPMTPTTVRVSQLQFENLSVGKARNIDVVLSVNVSGTTAGPGSTVTSTLRSAGELRNR